LPAAAKPPPSGIVAIGNPLLRIPNLRKETRNEFGLWQNDENAPGA
jgi:hypothetical protein